MIAPTPFFSHRGSHIRILEEARALEKRGHDIVIVTYHVGDDIHKYIDTKIDVRRIRRWLFWYKKTEAGADWQKLILNIFLFRKTFYMYRTWKPDVIHGHLHEGILIGRLVQLLVFWRRTPLVSDFHGSLVGEMRSHGYLSLAPLPFIFKMIEQWINNMGDTAIVSSTEHLNVIKKARRDHRAYHIYDGVDTDNYDAVRSRKAELKDRYGIVQDTFVVGYTGALIANKGVGHILEAARLLCAKSKEYTFIIGGFPDLWVRAYVAHHGLEQFVHVISPLNYFLLPEINTLADVTIDPKEDGVGQASGKILQYAGAHTAVVCADRSTNRRYLEDAGIYVSTVTPEMLVKTLEDLYTKPDVVARKSEHAYQRARAYSWDKVGEKLEGVYQSIIRKAVV